MTEKVFFYPLSSLFEVFKMRCNISVDQNSSVHQFTSERQNMELENTGTSQRQYRGKTGTSQRQYRDKTGTSQTQYRDETGTSQTQYRD